MREKERRRLKKKELSAKHALHNLEIEIWLVIHGCAVKNDVEKWRLVLLLLLISVESLLLKQKSPFAKGEW